MDRGKRKTRNGVVVSNKMNKTAVVEVEKMFRHPLYQKVVRVSRKHLAHDENNICMIGDLVEIMETRKLSARKRWRVVRVIGKGKVKVRELTKEKIEEKTSDTTA